VVLDDLVSAVRRSWRWLYGRAEVAAE